MFFDAFHPSAQLKNFEVKKFNNFAEAAADFGEVCLDGFEFRFDFIFYNAANSFEVFFIKHADNIDPGAELVKSALASEFGK